MSEKMYCTASVVVVGGNKRIELVGGTVCDVSEVSSGSLDSLVRTGVLVSIDDAPSDDKEEVENWRDMPISKLDITDTATKALARAGLQTVNAVIDYGESNGTLTTIRGVGEETESSIKRAIESIIP